MVLDYTARRVEIKNRDSGCEGHMEFYDSKKRFKLDFQGVMGEYAVGWFLKMGLSLSAKNDFLHQGQKVEAKATTHLNGNFTVNHRSFNDRWDKLILVEVNDDPAIMTTRLVGWTTWVKYLNDRVLVEGKWGPKSDYYLCSVPYEMQEWEVQC